MEALDQFSQRLPARPAPESSRRSEQSWAPARARGRLGSGALVRPVGARQVRRHAAGTVLGSRPRPRPAGSRVCCTRLVRLEHEARPPTVDLEEDAASPARQFLREADGIQAAVWIVARLAEGLDHAHSRGLLHRDLKPSNILIAADGTPMLLDFNLAAETEPEGVATGRGASPAGHARRHPAVHVARAPRRLRPGGLDPRPRPSTSGPTSTRWA